MLNKLLKLLKLKSNPHQGVKRISNSVQIKSSQGTVEDEAVFDEYQYSNFESRVSELQAILEKAQAKTREFQDILVELQSQSEEQSKDKTTEELISDIISACDEISLNGIKILAGGEIALSLKDSELNIKLPNHATNAFGLQDGNDYTNAETKVHELHEAIEKSKKEVQRATGNLEVSKQNVKSAGIKISSLDALIDGR